MEWSPYHWTLGGADSLCFIIAERPSRDHYLDMAQCSLKMHDVSDWFRTDDWCEQLENWDSKGGGSCQAASCLSVEGMVRTASKKIDMMSYEIIVCVCVTWQRWLKHWPLFLNCINREANIYLYISRGSMINWTCTTSWIRSTTQHSLDSYSWSSLNGFHILGFCMEHHFILNDCKPFSFYLSPWVLSMAWTMSSH